jgi:hypothetical protein
MIKGFRAAQDARERLPRLGQGVDNALTCRTPLRRNKRSEHRLADGDTGGLDNLTSMTSEIFKANWRGWARSPEGYAVRLMGRNDLQYRDELGELRIFAEPMADWTNIVVDTSTIPDRSERSRQEVVSRLRRAFAYRGWTFIEVDS